jgi:hypothetical protein
MSSVISKTETLGPSAPSLKGSGLKDPSLQGPGKEDHPWPPSPPQNPRTKSQYLRPLQSVRQFYFPIFPLARFLVESNVGESTFPIQGASFGKRASEPDPGNTEYRVDFRHCAPSLCPTSAKEIWFCSNGCHWPRPVGGDAGAEPRHSLRACGARPSRWAWPK